MRRPGELVGEVARQHADAAIHLATARRAGRNGCSRQITSVSSSAHRLPAANSPANARGRGESPPRSSARTDHDGQQIADLHRAPGPRPARSWCRRSHTQPASDAGTTPRSRAAGRSRTMADVPSSTKLSSAGDPAADRAAGVAQAGQQRARAPASPSAGMLQPLVQRDEGGHRQRRPQRLRAMLTAPQIEADRQVPTGPRPAPPGVGRGSRSAQAQRQARRRGPSPAARNAGCRRCGSTRPRRRYRRGRSAAPRRPCRPRDGSASSGPCRPAAPRARRCR